MQILRTNKSFWTYISGVYAEKNEKFANRVLSIFLNLFHLFNLCAVVIGSCLKYYVEKDDLNVEHIMLLSHQIFTNSSLTLNFVVYCFRKSSLMILIEKFQKIVNSRYNVISAELYEHAEQKSRMVTIWPFTFYCVSYDGAMLIATTVCWLYSMITGDVNVHKWPNIVQMRLSFVS